MPSRFEPKRVSLTLAALAIWLSAVAPMPASRVLAQSAPAPAPDEFTHRGIQPGEQLPDLPVYALDGTEEGLANVDRAAPMLLLTSSYTCPKSRSSYPRAEAMAEKIGDRRLRVAIIYVLEAHPKGDPSPYRGYEDVTAENRRDGILCRQPRTINGCG